MNMEPVWLLSPAKRDKAQQDYGKLGKGEQMLGLVSSMQRAVDLLGSGRTGRRVRFAHLPALFMCGVTLLLTVSVASAFAEARFTEYYTPFTQPFTLCEGDFSETCHEATYKFPAGMYEEDTALTLSSSPHAYERIHEEETCRNPEKLEECTEEHVSGGVPLEPGFRQVFSTPQLVLSGPYWGEGITKFFTSYQWAYQPPPAELFGEENENEPKRKYCMKGRPVNCATGNQVVTQTDMSVGGRGPTLEMARTYNSLLAVKQSTPGPFGYGWTGSYSAHLEYKGEGGYVATVYLDNGSAATFTRSGATWTATSGLVEATLADESGGFLYTLPDQTKLHFNSGGMLVKEEDRNGNSVTLAYKESQLETATDGAGRKLTFKYNGSGEVESVTDPMGHTVKYTYESGDLVSVTQPGETELRWKFQYNSERELTSETDGREHTATTEYNGERQVVSQTDAMSRKRTWKYSMIPGVGTETVITEPNGAKTVEQFNEYGSPTSVTQAAETSIAATITCEYNEADELIALTDPNKHKTEYGYDSAGNRTSEKNADGDETKWTYDSTHDVETETKPNGETTTIKREAHGNPEVIERPAPGSTTQKTTYKYDGHGDVESMEDPLKRVYKYEYDSYGDRTGETDPEGNKRTWEYNEDSQEIAMVSPRGNAKKEASKFTTKIERDAQGRPLVVTDPLGHATKYAYDGNGNMETITDPNLHTTTYTYDADNEPIKVKQPNGIVTETSYDAAGQVVSQTDGKKHVTKYVRNPVEEVTEIVDPLKRKTIKEYDKAGNLTSLTDPAKRTTTYTYDPANRLKEVSYSDGKTPTVKYEYDADGDRTKMIDGTGTTTYVYDELDRPIEDKDGHGNVTSYEYDLANEQTKITYPNGKSVTRVYDKDGRLQKITDWLEHSTKFTYNADSDLNVTTFPSSAGEEDKYTYNEADQMSEVVMSKGAETLASLVYARDADGQVKTTTSKGLPGEEKTSYVYDENNRLTKSGSTAYEYNLANNPNKIGATTYTYNEGNELETGTSLKYTYDELGERTKTTPSSGPTTSYGYDEAGNLTSVMRPKEGEISLIEDTYAYDGNGLRASQTISGTTSYLAWDITEGLPLLLNDGTNNYIYGPSGLPVEQINNTTGTVTYLHHDQAGSTRLLTGSTGTVTGKCTYSAYGTPTCEGTATTPLGFDAQYTSADTGLIYLRARTYDPATAQFLSVDPMVGVTRAPYNYANDNPLNRGDASGLSSWNPFSESFWTEGNFISESPLNPIRDYEEEISSYENGCGYLASVAHGLEGAVVGALDVSGAGEEAAGTGEGAGVTGWGTFLNELAEATGHHYVFIGSSALAVVGSLAGVGYLIYEKVK